MTSADARLAHCTTCRAVGKSAWELNYSMAANVHKNPTYRGENMLWNVIDKSHVKSQLLEDADRNEWHCGLRGQIAGNWEEVLKSRVTNFARSQRD